MKKKKKVGWSLLCGGPERKLRFLLRLLAVLRLLLIGRLSARVPLCVSSSVFTVTGLCFRLKRQLLNPHESTRNAALLVLVYIKLAAKLLFQYHAQLWLNVHGDNSFGKLSFTPFSKYYSDYTSDWFTDNWKIKKINSCSYPFLKENCQFHILAFFKAKSKMWKSSPHKYINSSHPARSHQ